MKVIKIYSINFKIDTTTVLKKHGANNLLLENGLDYECPTNRGYGFNLTEDSKRSKSMGLG